MIRDFDPEVDILLIALPEDPSGGLDHKLDVRRDRTGGFLEVGLSHTASGARYRLLLPGVERIEPSSVAVLSLEDADRIAPAQTPRPDSPNSANAFDSATDAHGPVGPRKLAFVHRHDWYRDGPPTQRFFDLSDPQSELHIRLAPDTGGPIYAVRLTERNGAADSSTSDVQRSIILTQTAPGTPHLSSSLLSQWFTSRLGGDDFRVLAWVWLGNEGCYTDTDSGERRDFGRINKNPNLAIHGPLAGSIVVERQNGT